MPRTSIEAKRSLHKVLLCFAGWFTLFLVFVALLWPFVAPAYNRIVVAGAGWLLALVEEPNITVIRADAATASVYRRVADGSEPLAFSDFGPYTYVGFVPLVALLLATPGLSWKRRGGLTAVGVLLLMVFHIVYLVITVKLLYVFCGLDEVGNAAYRVYDWGQIMVRVLWEASAVLLWVALTLGHWRRVVRQTAKWNPSRHRRAAVWESVKKGLQRG